MAGHIPEDTPFVPEDLLRDTVPAQDNPDLPVHHAPVLNADSERPKILTAEEIRRIGALQVEEERSSGLTQFLAEQRGIYEDMSKEQLIEALLARERVLALEGRQLADGRIGGQLLREFVRGLLVQSDHAALRRIGDATKTGQVEQILQALGAPPADASQLKRHGTTLGDADKEAAQREANTGKEFGA